MYLFPLKLPEKTILIADRGLVLRAPQRKDFEHWRNLREESRDFLVPWEPPWPRDDLTRRGFRRRLRNYTYERRIGRGETFFLIDCASAKPIGGISISNIRRGVSHSCTIGYWMGIRFANRGYMKHALQNLLAHIFNDLRLLRVEAACLPDNTASIRLLESVGFSREGFLRKYLNINGKRRDHILYSFLIDDIREQT